MAKISVNDIVGWFQRMYTEHWKYVWGDAQYGQVDCSGAFVYVYKQYGWTIAHGSNAIARKYVKSILPIADAKPGMAAFKYKKPGQDGYSLPDKYKQGGADYNGDTNDYYHIGLVDESGKYVLNAQGTASGFTRTSIDKWGAVGYLDAVDYTSDIVDGSTSGADNTIKIEVPITMTNAVIKTDNGLGVNFRKEKSTSAGVYGKIPNGADVTVTADDGTWSAVEYNGHNGYVMTKFIEHASATNSTEKISIELSLDYDSATDLYQRLGKKLGEYAGAVG